MPPPEIAPKQGSQIVYWVVALLALGSLTLFFSNVVDERNNPNQRVDTHMTTDGRAEIVLKQNRSGHYVVTGAINDEAVEFLLDTGATDVSVPASVAKRAGLRAGEAQWASTANGRIEVFSTRIARIDIGELRLRNVAASINPNIDGDEVLLGMSALRELHMTQTDGTLTIRTP